MMGMQPGMGPNAHALSHLQPQQAQMFQQQQQHPGMSMFSVPTYKAIANHMVQ
jgi:hypothetical protein